MVKMFPKSLPDRLSGQVVWTVLLVGMILLLAACGPATGPDTAAPTPVIESAESTDSAESADLTGADGAYPAPVESQPEEAYPPPVEAPSVEESYPVEPLPAPTPTPMTDSYPLEEETFAEPRFRIDLPLTMEDQVVTGQAPPNLALAIVDISAGGQLLGTGVSTEDARFSIGVPGLPDGSRIGITFAELQPGKTYADMSIEYFPYRGEGFTNVPNVGIFFDSALVGE